MSDDHLELRERIAQLEAEKTVAEDRARDEREAREKAERECAVAEEQARIERERAERAVAAVDRKARTHTPKALPPPWQDPYAKKFGGKGFTPALLLIAARIALSELGPADFGPPPEGMDGVAQKGSKSVPRIHIRKWIQDALDFEPGGIRMAGEKIEKKIDTLQLTAREDVLRVFRVLIYLALIIQCGGDEAKAQAMWPRFDEVQCWDPAAVGADETADRDQHDEKDEKGPLDEPSCGAGGEESAQTFQARRLV